jgi:hypothetical protein
LNFVTPIDISQQLTNEPRPMTLYSSDVMNTVRQTWLQLASLLLICCSGCATFDLGKRIPWSDGDEGKASNPTRLMVVWTDAIMNQAGQQSVRGFGGRVVFFNQANEPVKVKGTLVIYAYDETNRNPIKSDPEKTFVFLAKDLEKKYSKCRIGDSYSIWVPWDAVGGKQTEISLIVVFQPEKGAEIVGDQSKQLLPGIPNTPNAATPAATPGMLPGGQLNTLPAPIQQPNFQGTMSTVPGDVIPASAHSPVVTGPTANGLPSVMTGDANVVNGTSANAGTMQTYTIPLRGNNAVTRPIEALRQQQTLPPAPNDLPALPNQGAMQMQQQNLMMQQQLALLQAQQLQQAQTLQQPVQQAVAHAGMVPALPSVTGATPLSTRDDLNFQARQPRPNWKEKAPSATHMIQLQQTGSPNMTVPQQLQQIQQNQVQPMASAPGAPGLPAMNLPGNSPEVLREPPAGSLLSRRQALGGTISRLDPAHAR